MNFITIVTKSTYSTSELATSAIIIIGVIFGIIGFAIICGLLLTKINDDAAKKACDINRRSKNKKQRKTMLVDKSVNITIVGGEDAEKLIKDIEKEMSKYKQERNIQ